MNLEPQPFGITGDAPTTSSTILELPSDALEALVGHLCSSMHRLGATCALLNSVIKSDDAFWQAHLNHPLIAPYRATKMVNATAYCEALHIRAVVFLGLATPWTTNYSHDRFVRSVAVDFDAHPHVTTIAIGLSSGAVAVAAVPKSSAGEPSGPITLSAALGSSEVDNLNGEVHEEQVLAVALHAASGLVISGCGRLLPCRVHCVPVRAIGQSMAP